MDEPLEPPQANHEDVDRRDDEGGPIDTDPLEAQLSQQGPIPGPIDPDP